MLESNTMNERLLSVALKGVLTCALMVTGWSVSAQQYLHQVVVINEGWSNWQTGEVLEPAILGVYDPNLQIYTSVDTIEDAGFVSDALIHGSDLYVAADGQVLRYDLDSFELLVAAEVIGVRQLAWLDGNLYVTRGEVDENGMNLPLDSYLLWLDPETLEQEGELVASSAGPQYATEGIEVMNGRIYIAVNNAFDYMNEVGLIGMYDPVSDEYEEWDLGEEGKNPIHLFVDGGQLYTVNNRDYASTSLSVISPMTSEVSTYAVAETNAGCLAAVLSEGSIRYQVAGEGQVRSAQVDDLAMSSAWLNEVPDYYGMAVNPVSGNLYASVTDYSTFGLIEIRDANGALVSQFDCGVSPGVICMDVRSLVSACGPNLASKPCQGELLFDLLGRQLNGLNQGWKFEVDELGNKRIRMHN